MERIKTSLTVDRQMAREQFERENVPLAVRKYSDVYLRTFGRKPLSPIQLRLLETGRGEAQYNKIFSDILRFLYTQRLSRNAKNDIITLLHDYYTIIIQRYLRFNRAPTIKQISPSPTNVSEFISFTIREENTSGASYWISAKDKEEADRLIQSGGTKFNDPIVQAARRHLSDSLMEKN